MESWLSPTVPRLPDLGPRPLVPDTATGALVDPAGADEATLYVCGITPYDATHLGHAATYLLVDTLVRAWLDAGLAVRTAQNVTDIDDPLLERASATGVDWRELAAEQTALYRGDMAALGVLAPDALVAVTDRIAAIADAAASLERSGLAYRVGTPEADGDDLYFAGSAAASDAWELGRVSGLGGAAMRELSAERGGDPDRAGKRDALDPLLWRAERDGEPAWDGAAGRGRPGWHLECTVIAAEELGSTVGVQAGGDDLVFPHHEWSAGHGAALSGEPFARAYLHAGMVGLDGEKMSKSLGNLVLVSRLRADGADPRDIRLAILAAPLRRAWAWTAERLAAATERRAAWEAALARAGEPGSAAALVASLRAAIAAGLDTVAAIDAVDAGLAGGTDDAALVVDAVDALLGVRLTP